MERTMTGRFRELGYYTMQQLEGNKPLNMHLIYTLDSRFGMYHEGKERKWVILNQTKGEKHSPSKQELETFVGALEELKIKHDYREQ